MQQKKLAQPPGLAPTWPALGALRGRESAADMGKSSRKQRKQQQQEYEWLPSGVRLVRLTEHSDQNHLRIPAGQLLYSAGVARNADTCLAIPEAVTAQRRTLLQFTGDDDPRMIQYVALDRSNRVAGVIHARVMCDLVIAIDRAGLDPAPALDALNITQMAVSPAHRRSGIGSDLIRAVENYASLDDRYRVLTLFAEGDLAALRALYAGLGFTCGTDGEKNWPGQVIPTAISQHLPSVRRYGFFCWKAVR